VHPLHDVQAEQFAEQELHVVSHPPQDEQLEQPAEQLLHDVLHVPVQLKAHALWQLPVHSLHTEHTPPQLPLHPPLQPPEQSVWQCALHGHDDIYSPFYAYINPEAQLDPHDAVHPWQPESHFPEHPLHPPMQEPAQSPVHAPLQEDVDPSIDSVDIFPISVVKVGAFSGSSLPEAACVTPTSLTAYIRLMVFSPCSASTGLSTLAAFVKS
jgi:hypothetical protein